MSYLDNGKSSTYTETEPIEIPVNRDETFSSSVPGSQINSEVITTSTRLIDSSNSSIDRFGSSSFTPHEMGTNLLENNSSAIGMENFSKTGLHSSFSEKPAEGSLQSPSILRQDVIPEDIPLKCVSELNSSSNLDSEANETGKQPLMHHMDIATFPTDKLLDMLTGLLTKIIKSNDSLGSIQGSETIQNSPLLREILSFRGKQVPGITLKQYFQRIQKYCPTTNDVLLSLLVHFDRIAKKCNAIANEHFDADSSLSQQQIFVMDSHNIHRLIIAAITVSTKFISDFFYSNSRYARVGGISLQELNHLELQFLILCDFRLIISVEELQRYADLLYRFWGKEMELGQV